MMKVHNFPKWTYILEAINLLGHSFVSTTVSKVYKLANFVVHNLPKFSSQCSPLGKFFIVFLGQV